MKATDFLSQDHREVATLFQRFEQTPAANGERRQELMDQIAEELDVHAKLEEEIFYPAVRGVSRLVTEAREAHDKVRALIGDAEGREASSSEFAMKVTQLKQMVEHHVAEEEGAMFREAESLGATELDRLGSERAERKRTLKESLLQRGIRGMKPAAKKIA